ncbi:MAG: hypothetical protein UR26_C0009G0011 [candidate division TM6 bacterium GW2011_GWF2_32_72]|nr:MAG: hypothetical protein UR26_C0009G0011 [candidate division TM6 bacterium GW2011_GWF2_32_72]
MLLQLVNLRPDVERATNVGRIDLLVQTNKVLYIFEFKLNGSAKKALQHEAYQAKNKNVNNTQIKLVGVNFSSEAKNINEYLVRDLV